jgi:DNA-binding NtrC family response regulator
MPLPAQSKLLRVLQEGEVRRIGSVHPRKVDVRLIAATHQDLQKKVISGEFRQDLLYRLEVVRIEVPALRDRMQDLDLLIDYFVQQVVCRHQLPEPKITPEWRERLHQHSWPGNIRELSNVIERSVILAASGVLDCQVLPPHLQKKTITQLQQSDQVLQIPIGSSLKDVESMLIRKTLEATDGDKEETARLLGVHSRTIYRWLKEEERK